MNRFLIEFNESIAENSSNKQIKSILTQFYNILVVFSSYLIYWLLKF